MKKQSAMTSPSKIPLLASSDISDESEPDSEPDPDRKFNEMSKFFNEARQAKGKGKASAKKKATAEELGPSGKRYTPLEKQVLAFKKKYPGSVLMIEVGYKYRFYGDDAKVAAKELGMGCYMKGNFLLASIPIHRGNIHMKNLINLGYKVGIISQIETAALKKAGDNRNTVFERDLTSLVTATTFVDELDTSDESDEYSSPRLVCVVEQDESHIAFICVSPSDGEVIWDMFDDTHLRIELETRMAHLKPHEMLIPRKISNSSEQMLRHFIEETSSMVSRSRLEYVEDVFDYSEAFDYITQTSRQRADSGLLIAAITDLPKPVVVALACSIRHLTSFNRAAPLMEAQFFNRFTSQAKMHLAANTLSNLEIFQNETDHTVRGSLVSILDNTRTRFGKRMLKSWIGAPLVDKTALQERIDAVEEVKLGPSQLFHLRQILKTLPDLARGLCRIQYRQCTPSELVRLLQSFHKVGTAFQSVPSASQVGFKSMLLNRIIFALPPLEQPTRQLLNELDIAEARMDHKDRMWADANKFPQLEEHAMALGTVEEELKDELPRIRELLRIPGLEFTADDQYLVEVPKTHKKHVPDDWPVPTSATKKIERYHSPVVARKLIERARWRESLAIESKRAFLAFLDEVSQHYAIMRHAVQQLATVDCLSSLAQVALDGNYVKPTFLDDGDGLEIVDGRHPMIEVLRSDPFVPNSISFSSSSSKIITGPNMGGKSSSVRMIALIAIMAQIGSYCPASSVKLCMFDSVLTRMGAYDEISRGRSTFMVELTETSEILRAASPRSLVILDELGRGTSTFDGMAIADAVLEHLVTSTRCNTLFITHYPLVASNLEKKFPQRVENLHVGYCSDLRSNGKREVTFLYRLEAGIAPDSFGVECARLAGLPESILERAASQSQAMEKLVANRTRQNLAHKRLLLLKDLLADGKTRLERTTALATLKSLAL
ncbi:DNA mismatch repair protein [Mycena indigotica]|uniref:DNA mismatch repair protein MSH3 n=1 Tax=Mycena indigotica TaxID=2126181 RepID=A0A8H6VYM3_9AGAR|nr:DNA mismatch repair protein [Mycena indigotica]KAF7295053.1 DNA mismatch repair protein [Mycena indigotica]